MRVPHARLPPPHSPISHLIIPSHLQAFGVVSVIMKAGLVLLKFDPARFGEPRSVAVTAAGLAVCGAPLALVPALWPAFFAAHRWKVLALARLVFFSLPHIRDPRAAMNVLQASCREAPHMPRPCPPPFPPVSARRHAQQRHAIGRAARAPCLVHATSPLLADARCARCAGAALAVKDGARS